MIDNPREYEVMAEVEANHWWYRVLHSLVLRNMDQHTPSHNVHVLDAGCGTGGLMHSLIAAGYDHVKGFDLSEIAVEICKKNGLDVEIGDLCDLGSIQAPSQFDVIISNDTLCYLSAEQRSAFVKNAYARLNPGGLLVMNMPALSAFRGTHDRAVGILHRFDRGEVQALVQSAGFQILTLRYWPLTLSPAIFLVRAWQRLTDNPASTVKPASDLKSYSGLLNTLLYRLIGLELKCLSRAPFGSSLFAVLRRP
jgi:2-polyprenyl-3-methyl-5-hydroxy-6-metoxy-1,4-benzoquinol methylase